MEVERLSNLVDAIDKPTVPDTTHCAPCCDSNADLEFLALMAHHKSVTTHIYICNGIVIASLYGAVSVRLSVGPSIRHTQVESLRNTVVFQNGI